MRSDPDPEREAILAAAEARDVRAEIRDRNADEREQAASLRSFLGVRDRDADPYTEGMLVRRAAALDRVAARADRAAAASDRARLSRLLSEEVLAGDAGRGASRDLLLTELLHELGVELRGPLTSMLASVQLLADQLGGHPDPTVAPHLGRIARAGERAVRMLDQWVHHGGRSRQLT